VRRSILQSQQQTLPSFPLTQPRSSVSGKLTALATESGSLSFFVFVPLAVLPYPLFACSFHFRSFSFFSLAFEMLSIFCCVDEVRVVKKRKTAPVEDKGAQERIQNNSSWMLDHKHKKRFLFDRAILELPSSEIRARGVTMSHVDVLATNFERTNSTRVFHVVIRNSSLHGRLRSGGWDSVAPSEFTSIQLRREIIAGAHSFVATERLAAKDPTNATWRKLSCELYITPADEDSAKQLSLFGTVENLKSSTAKAMDFGDMLRQFRGRLLLKPGKKQKGEVQEMAAEFAVMNPRLAAKTIVAYSNIAFWPEELWRLVDLLLEVESADHKKLVNSPTLFLPLNVLQSNEQKAKMLNVLVTYCRQNPGKIMSSSAFKTAIAQEQASITVKEFMMRVAEVDGGEWFEVNVGSHPDRWTRLTEILPSYTRSEFVADVTQKVRAAKNTLSVDTRGMISNRFKAMLDVLQKKVVSDIYLILILILFDMLIWLLLSPYFVVFVAASRQRDQRVLHLSAWQRWADIGAAEWRHSQVLVRRESAPI